MRDGLKTTEVQQLAAATIAVISLIVLAVLNAWPFDSAVPIRDDDVSILDVALGDRLTIGLIRTAVIAVVGYVVVSVPALVLERRWMQGLTTTGFTTHDDRIAEPEGAMRHLARLHEAVATNNDHAARLAKAVESLRAKRSSSEESDDDR